MRNIVQYLYQLVHTTGHDRAVGSRTVPIAGANVQVKDSGGGDILRSRMSAPLLSRKPWSWALHNAVAMAVPYSFSRAGNVGADNQRPHRYCQRQAQTTTPEGVGSVLDPDGDAALPGVVRQPIDDLTSAATS